MRSRNTDKEELVKQKTIELLVKDGLEGFSVNKLAKACGISVATLYIYYKDKDDLIIQVALEEGKRMTRIMLDGLHPEQSFEEGMRVQWKNRLRYMTDCPTGMQFYELLRTSTYHEKVFKVLTDDFKESIGKFMDNVLQRGEIKPMPLEVYWSVAFAPLYNLVRFDREGQSIGGKPFKLNDDVVWQTFDLVMKAFRN